ncbi:MAG TPA: PilZ domain-containing protein [Vicinamibacteria bacterium]|nr:PilZ domain-containing protein [Vicinamibacteria bacterium]
MVEGKRPERRKEARIALHVPVKVQGRGGDGATWEEMTSSEDASMAGISFRLRRAVRIGHALHLALPLPKRLRRYDLTDPSYHVYALVRSVGPGTPSRVGLIFLGKHPPRGETSLPSGLFLMPNDPRPDERRRFPRAESRLGLKLRRTSVPGTLLEEQTYAENLSKWGALVKTSLPVAKGEMVEIEDLKGTFHTRAEIRNVSIGADGQPRLNLLFLDHPTPDGLLPPEPAP